MNKTAEVVVIGGGVIGSSVAYYLAKKGLKVIVIEKNQGLCFGASGANLAGLVIQNFESPLLEFVRESIKMYGNLSEEIGYNIEYERLGCLLVIDDEDQYPNAVKHVESMRTKGINVQLLEGNEIRKLEPVLGEDLIAGMEDWEGGMVNPFKVTYGFARAAAKLGTSFLLSTEVRKIETNKKEKIISVDTDRGKIETDFVVNAAGAWASEIGEMLGISIPIRPLRGQAIVTEPVPLNERWRCIGDPPSHWAKPSSPKTAEKTKDSVVRLGGRTVIRQESTGNWLIGTSQELAYNNRVTMETIRRHAKGAMRFIPKLKDVNCIRAYAGLRSHCYVDDLPILGKVDSPSGFVLATGHSGEGLMLAPLTGKLISELITENRTSMPINAFSFSRFKKLNQ